MNFKDWLKDYGITCWLKPNTFFFVKKHIFWIVSWILRILNISLIIILGFNKVPGKHLLGQFFMDPHHRFLIVFILITSFFYNMINIAQVDIFWDGVGGSFSGTVLQV